MIPDTEDGFVPRFRAAAAAEARRGPPLRPEDVASRVALLGALRGQPVAAGALSGRHGDTEETETGLRVAILTAAGAEADPAWETWRPAVQALLARES